MLSLEVVMALAEWPKGETLGEFRYVLRQNLGPSLGASVWPVRNQTRQLTALGELVREPIRLMARELYRPQSTPNQHPCQGIRNSNRADNSRSPLK